MSDSTSALTEYRWSPQPNAAAFVHQIVHECLEASPAIRRLADRMRTETGNRFIDWIDHLVIPADEAVLQRLDSEGYKPTDDGRTWRISSGLFPPIRVHESGERQLAIKVESVRDFLLANGWGGSVPIERGCESTIRYARVIQEGDIDLIAIERHGEPSLDLAEAKGSEAFSIAECTEDFLLRRRAFEDASDGFVHSRQRFDAAAAALGRDRACDLFFAAERAYWQSRNRAARIQKSRQDALGLGWANHDHHTYRSSRRHFAELIGVLERMGFTCRERFYAGREAGWGAQVLEHPRTSIVIFADVDLLPDEVAMDFAHEPLAERDRLGTVGLWCALHGEAFLQAGMHHLECQFDFDAAREQLAAAGIESMKPFTDLPYLRQAFTRGEHWPVDARRIDWLESLRLITPAQAATFRERGAVGSHLEILQRDDGYKGFNQSGINEIIRDTDPRLLTRETVLE